MKEWLQQYSIIKEKISSALTEQGKNVSRVTIAEFLDATRGKVQAWEGGQRPSADDLQKISDKLGLSPTWLLMGTGDPLGTRTTTGIRRLTAHATPDRACVVSEEGETDIEGYVVGVHALTGAGPASTLLDHNALFKICIPPDYYRPAITVFKVDGESMEPLIRRGAFVGIDTEKTGLTAGQIYVVDIPHEGWTLKRVFHDPKAAELILKSINPEHPDQRLPIDGREGLLVGRAVWVMQGL